VGGQVRALPQRARLGDHPQCVLSEYVWAGVYFRSNSQGFRNNEDFSKEIPAGKFRIVCSEDSFTMGPGVTNDQTRCQALTQLDNRFQTINMGQGAYGPGPDGLLVQQRTTAINKNATPNTNPNVRLSFASDRRASKDPHGC
jgi:hypothetical protein